MMKPCIRRRYALLLLPPSVVLIGACAGPSPKLFPVAPVEVRSLSDGGVRRWYDTDGNHRADYFEQLSPAGRLTEIGYGTPDTESSITTVRLDEVPREERRHLMLLLDSIPFAMVEEAWAQGRFRYCERPSRTISPFPVMTDMSFSEFLGTSPSPGIESSYYNGKQLTDGYDVYANGGNVGWQRFVDYRLNPVAHVSAYLEPYPWFGHELRQIQDLYLEGKKGSGTFSRNGPEGASQKRYLTPFFAGYAVGTSAIGARRGRGGHQIALCQVDRFCQYLLFKTRGRARFTLLSDHGHEFYTSKRIPLREMLEKRGYRVTHALKKPDDVVVPEFGMVSMAAIHTKDPARVAGDVLGIEGMEISAYPDGDELMVLSRDGRAHITCRCDAGARPKPTAFRYQCEFGDPLALWPTLSQLSKQGSMDGDGFIDDRVLFEATVSTTYPDAVARLWRAFHGLVQHPPDVLVSMKSGYHCGSALMSSLVTLVGIHGSLRQESSSGFVMTTEGRLPPVLRMADLKPALQQLGVPFHDAPTSASEASR